MSTNTKYELLSLLDKYYKLFWDLYNEHMQDSPNNTKLNDLEKEQADIANQITQISKDADAYNTFLSIIEYRNPDAFTVMISNLDSNPSQYETLYDLFKEFNSIHTSTVTFPTEALQNIKIIL